MIQATLGFLIKDDKILLAVKKRGFGVGKYNGFGGKLEKGESVEDCLIREAREEINIELNKFKKVADLEFYFPTKKEWDLKVTAFICSDWKGSPKESEEMLPKWFKINEIPYEKMWADDLHWLPMVLDGKIIEGDFYFKESGEVIKHTINSKK